MKYLEIKAKLGLVENVNEDEQVITEKLGDSNLDGKITNVIIFNQILNLHEIKKKTIQTLLKE